MLSLAILSFGSRYTTTETNDGEVDLNNPTITDSFKGVLDLNVDCDVAVGDDVFEVDEVITCTYDRTITVEDCGATIHNDVKSTTIAGDPVEDEFAEDDVPVAPCGGEGCTPGYWKQKQHFDSWPASVVVDDVTIPITQDTKYNAVFGVVITINPDNAGKNKSTQEDPTLLQALNANGGGINALARHSVAALLNAGSTGVDYAFSVDQVVDMVQAAVADPTDPDTGISATHLRFATENERGCPLN